MGKNTKEMEMSMNQCEALDNWCQIFDKKNIFTVENYTKI